MSEVAQWLACWAHNPKVPGSKPGFATQVACVEQTSRGLLAAEMAIDRAIVSQTGVWTGLQPQGCGDTERFNSSSVAAGGPYGRLRANLQNCVPNCMHTLLCSNLLANCIWIVIQMLQIEWHYFEIVFRLRFKF